MAKEESKKVKNNNFKNFKAELKKVIWPTPKQLANSTVAVISVVLITALIVFVLDFGFELMNKYGINKLRDAVASNNTTAVTTTEEQSGDNIVANSENSNTDNQSENNAVEENNVEETANTEGQIENSEVQNAETTQDNQ